MASSPSSRDPEAGAGGSSTLLFPEPGTGANRLEVPGTAHLGHRFTLAVRVKALGRDRMRLFSTHRGSGVPSLGELIFDFSPGTGVLRLVVNGQEISAQAGSLAAGMYHHLAATYDRGRVHLYVDGRIAGSGRVLSGSARLGRDDRVVEMFGPPGAPTLAGVHLADNSASGSRPGWDFRRSRMGEREFESSPAHGLGGRCAGGEESFGRTRRFGI